MLPPINVTVHQSSYPDTLQDASMFAQFILAPIVTKLDPNSTERFEIVIDRRHKSVTFWCRSSLTPAVGLRCVLPNSVWSFDDASITSIIKYMVCICFSTTFSQGVEKVNTRLIRVASDRSVSISREEFHVESLYAMHFIFGSSYQYETTLGDMFANPWVIYGDETLPRICEVLESDIEYGDDLYADSMLDFKDIKSYGTFAIKCRDSQTMFYFSKHGLGSPVPEADRPSVFHTIDMYGYPILR